MHDSTLYLVKVMVFDWEKAAEMIREYHPTKVTAGLHTDRGFLCVDLEYRSN